MSVSIHWGWCSVQWVFGTNDLWLIRTGAAREEMHGNKKL